MGRSKDGIRRRREQDRERKRRKYNTDPGFREAELVRRKAHYAKKVDAEKARSARNYKLNREERIEQRKEWSRRNPERQRETQYAYYANKPTTVISTASRELRSGRIGISEAYRRVGEALARENAQDRKRRRSRTVCDSDSEADQT